MKFKTLKYFYILFLGGYISFRPSEDFHGKNIQASEPDEIDTTKKIIANNYV